MFSWTSAEKTTLPIAFMVLVVVAVAIVFMIKNKSKKVRMIPLVAITVVMLVLELIKQFRQLGNYDLWSIPLHFCSTFMIWFSIASFARGRVQEIGMTMSVATGILFFVMFYINPTSIIGTSSANILKDFGSFHTFVYHHLVILFVFVAIGLRLYNPQYQDLQGITFMYTVYSAVAVIFAHVLNVNFTGLLYNVVGFMQAFLEAVGYVPYTLVMFGFGLAAILITTITATHIKEKITNHKSHTLNKNDNKLK